MDPFKLASEDEIAERKSEQLFRYGKNRNIVCVTDKRGVPKEDRANLRRQSDLLVHRALVRAYKLGEGGLTDEEADKRLARVLWNDPGTGVMRHADAGYDIARACAKEQGLKLPML